MSNKIQSLKDRCQYLTDQSVLKAHVCVTLREHLACDLFRVGIVRWELSGQTYSSEYGTQIVQHST